MNMYTERLSREIDAISIEDENFAEELFQVADLFRPFSEAMDEFLAAHGYQDDVSDIERKVSFLREKFKNAGITPPRDMRKWFIEGKFISRETAYQICFAFQLNVEETERFFQRVYARDRGFDCHMMKEAVYYFCIRNGYSYPDAEEIFGSRTPDQAAEGQRENEEVVLTGSIIEELNGLESREDMKEWLDKNADKFNRNNVTAYNAIQRLWKEIASPNGLLFQEREKNLPSLLDEDDSGIWRQVQPDDREISVDDAYFAIFQLDRNIVQRLESDRSIKPILKRLHENARESFPDRQGIQKILRGDKTSYETIRKWLILLSFYTFWARKAIDRGQYAARGGENVRCVTEMNARLVDAGYPEMYVGNPYDWVFFYAAEDDEPLFIFRYIWNELLTEALE